MEIPICVASEYNNPKIIQLMIDRGAKIERRDSHGNTPLMIAGTSGHVSVVEVLLQNHAAIEAESDITKNTALSVACSGGHADVVDLLVSRGANVEHRNGEGNSPLAIACLRGDENLVLALLSYGSKVDVINHKGETPLIQALRSENEHVVQSLLDNGANVKEALEILEKDNNKMMAWNIVSFIIITAFTGILAISAFITYFGPADRSATVFYVSIHTVVVVLVLCTLFQMLKSLEETMVQTARCLKTLGPLVNKEVYLVCDPTKNEELKKRTAMQIQKCSNFKPTSLHISIFMLLVYLPCSFCIHLSRIPLKSAMSSMDTSTLVFGYIILSKKIRDMREESSKNNDVFGTIKLN